MLPLRDDIPSRRFPILTLLLIGLNVLAFVGEIMLGPRVEGLILNWGLIPVRYTVPEVSRLFHPVEQAIPFVASMFLHGGWTHLIGNMWTLWIFGDNVEDRLGRAGFLALYFLGGFIAAAVHIFTNSGSPVPTIGASGAVAAVMGGYFRLYPHANVLMLVPPFFLGPYFVVPAVLFLGWWFILQFFSGTLTLFAGTQDFAGIAWWAHIGGFVFGALLCSMIRREHVHRWREEEKPGDRW